MLEDISSSSYGTELKFSQKMLLDVPHKLKVNGLQSEFALQRTSAKKLPTRVPYTKHWPIKQAQKFLSIKTILSHLVSSWKHFCRLSRLWACWPKCFYFDYCSWLNFRNWPPPLLWQWIGSGFFELLICMLEDISSSSYGTELKFSQKMLLDVPHKLKVNGLQSEFALQRTSAKKLPTRVPYTKHWPIKQAQKFLSIKTILSHLVSSWKHFCRFPRVWACWPMCFYFDYCSWLNCRNWPPPLLWQWIGSGFFELLICMLEDISSSSYGTELKFSQKMLLDVPHKLKVNGLQSEFALQRTSAKKWPTRVPYTKHWPIKQAQKFLSIKTILSHLVSSSKHFCRLPRLWACWPMCFYFDYCSWLNCRNWPPPLLWQWIGSGFFELLICMLEDISSSSYGTELKFSQKMLLDVPHKLKVNGLQSEFALQRTSAKK